MQTQTSGIGGLVLSFLSSLLTAMTLVVGLFVPGALIYSEALTAYGDTGGVHALVGIGFGLGLISLRLWGIQVFVWTMILYGFLIWLYRDQVPSGF